MQQVLPYTKKTVTTMYMACGIFFTNRNVFFPNSENATDSLPHKAFGKTAADVLSQRQIRNDFFDTCKKKL